ncbi:Probable LRR receptor-like serine/threonine-protein kinase At3g47570 [Linum perenne]
MVATTILLVQLLWFLPHFAYSSKVLLSNETDGLALLKFKSMVTGDPLGALSSWNDSVHFCEWYGVSCSKRHHGRVTVLNLSSHGLYGSISPHVGNLSFLKFLCLYNNNFIGEIPPEISHLHRLQRLSLHNNLLDGEIPSNISRCFNLIIFDVCHNKLVGRLPWKFSQLNKLQYLNVRSNNLSGSIPLAFGNLSSLLEFDGGENQLSERVPNTLGRLKSLTGLYLNFNNLSGEIPASIFNLTSLTKMLFDFNYLLNGSLPWNLGISLPNLEQFDVGVNQFTGSVPPSLSNASNLVQLGLCSNNFRGIMPSMASSNKLKWFGIAFNSLGSGKPNDLSFLSSLTNATNLISLDFGMNNFGGSLPEHLGNLSTSLKRLSFHTNKISGNIPSGIQYLANLAEFWAYGNDLSGTILSSIGKLKSLEKLHLYNNKLSGYIPSTIGNLTKLIELSMSNNYLYGEIPASIQNCQKILKIELAHNNLSGVIPLQVFSLTSLSIFLDLSSNRFTGTIPTEVGNMKNLGFLDLSHNMLSDSIPSSLGSCISLEGLYMQGNHLQVSSLLLLTVIGSCCFILLIKKRGKQDMVSTDDPKLLQLSYQTLFKATDGFSSANQIGVGSFGLRLNVAIDIASAVHYLHNYCGTPIVHCDLKPSNVLLDEDMVAHVGDFAVANPSSSTIGIKGTIGYAPPEYGMGNEVSIQGDIYSYGILQLELFTGRRPTDETFKDGLSLHNVVKIAMSKQRTYEVVDPILLDELLRKLTTHHSSSEEARKDLEELMSSILEIGVACSSDIPEARVSMSEVLSSLTAIKTSLIGRR